MIPGGGHFKLGPYVFTLFEEVGGPQSLLRPHYNHSMTSIFSNRTDISGRPGAQNLRPDIMLWDFDDWSGGEGNFVFSPADPTRYDFGTGNVRRPGYITSTPTRTDANVATGLTATLSTAGFMAATNTKVWYAANHNTAAGARVLRTSSDAVTWNGETIGSIANPEQFTAMCADGQYAYLGAINNTTSVRNVYRIAPGGAGVQFATAGSSIGFLGMGVLQQYLYGWTGARLFQYDITQTSFPVAGTNIYSTGAAFDNSNPLPSGYGGGVTVTDNSVCMFISDGNGYTQVHEFKAGVGAPIWGGASLVGFSAKAIGFVEGTLYLAGNYDTRAALWALNLSTRVPQFVGYFRDDQGTTLTPVSVAAGPGNEVLIGMKEGHVFIFTFDEQGLGAISLLDQVTGTTALQAVITFGSKRIATFDDTANLKFTSSYWNLDTDTSVVNGTFANVSGVWDFDLPTENNKVLMGFHVFTSALSATATMKIEYQLDESGSYTTAQTLTSGTYNYIKVSDASTYVPNPAGSATIFTETSNTKRFRSLRVRATGTGSGGSACPKLFSWTARARDWAYVETWEIVVKLEDEQPGRGKRNIQSRGWQIRQWLLAQKTNRNIVTFLDGYPFPEKTGSAADLNYTTNTVTVDDIEDLIQGSSEQGGSGQGFCRITLTSIAP